MGSAGCLYAGSIFRGTQQCSKRTYDVTVTIQDVDLDNSTFCGYVSILGLGEKQSNLITFFESEIIGPDYSFLTRKWEANESTDKNHWFRFVHFHPYRETFNKDECHHTDFSKKNFLFMRWKEQFIVPDHKVQQLDGASYDGFYYICFDKQAEKFEGYYHSRDLKTEKFQKLSVHHVKQKTFSAMALR